MSRRDEERARRLAAALRDNLKRRKSQQRESLAAEAAETAAPEARPEPEQP